MIFSVKIFGTTLDVLQRSSKEAFGGGRWGLEKGITEEPDDCRRQNTSPTRREVVIEKVLLTKEA